MSALVSGWKKAPGSADRHRWFGKSPHRTAGYSRSNNGTLPTRPSASPSTMCCALKQSAPLVTRLSPEMRLSASVSANGKIFRPWLLNGVWPVALEMSEHVIEYGRMFNELDDEMARSVCVIGTATRDELWGSPEKSRARNHSHRRNHFHQPCALHHHRHVQALRKRAGTQSSRICPGTPGGK